MKEKDKDRIYRAMVHSMASMCNINSIKKERRTEQQDQNLEHCKILLQKVNQVLLSLYCLIDNANNVEVREQKSADKAKWSKEDEHRLEDTIYFLDTAKKHYASIVELDACIDWLKSIKQRLPR